MDCTYLYGIIGTGEEINPGICGVDGAAPVCVVAHQGIAAVVSKYTGEAPRALPKESLVRCLFAHQRVVEHVMQGQTVLPVKFGTLLNNVEEVPVLLAQGHSRFASALAAIQDKVELEVAATWDTNRVLQEVATEDEVVRAMEAITRKGSCTVEERVRLGQIVKACLDQRRDSYRKRMLSFLSPLAIDVAPNALVSDEMVMNVAFLVGRDRQHQFDAAVEKLDELFQSGITFRVIGPLPPYSFSSVEITRVTPGEVEEARRTLGLAGTASLAEVRKTYRRLAAEEHRNPRPEVESVKDRLVSLRHASELLLSYCRALNEAEKDGRYGEDRSAATLPFLIAIKRTATNEIDPARFGGTIVIAERG